MALLKTLAPTRRGKDGWDRLTAQQQEEFKQAALWWAKQDESTRPSRTTVCRALIDRGALLSIGTAIRIFDALVAG